MGDWGIILRAHQETHETRCLINYAVYYYKLINRKTARGTRETSRASRHWIIPARPDPRDFPAVVKLWELAAVRSQGNESSLLDATYRCSCHFAIPIFIVRSLRNRTKHKYKSTSYISCMQLNSNQGTTGRINISQTKVNFFVNNYFYIWTQLFEWRRNWHFYLLLYVTAMIE